MSISQAALIECFRDTQACLTLEAPLKEATLRMQAATRLYLPGFNAIRPVEKCASPSIGVCADTAFHSAQRLADGGQRVAVLNFANPWEPGGGVTRGAMAQEECLCRSSNLYASLTLPYLVQNYYHHNSKAVGALGTDAVIHSPGVTVFKSDDDLPVRLEAPFQVDVLTCAAPYVDPNRRKPIRREVLENAIHRRVVNILEVAAAADVDALVLGAFGCGVFNNPPELVAECFRYALIGRGFGLYFRQVAFAIKANRGGNPNLEAFQRAFGG